GVAPGVHQFVKNAFCFNRAVYHGCIVEDAFDNQRVGPTVVFTCVKKARVGESLGVRCQYAHGLAEGMEMVLGAHLELVATWYQHSYAHLGKLASDADEVLDLGVQAWYYHVKFLARVDVLDALQQCSLPRRR